MSTGATPMEGSDSRTSAEPDLRVAQSFYLREYVTRAYLPQCAIPGITREDIEDKLRETIRLVTEEGQLWSVNWDLMDLPQVMIQKERARSVGIEKKEKEKEKEKEEEKKMDAVSENSEVNQEQEHSDTTDVAKLSSPQVLDVVDKYIGDLPASQILEILRDVAHEQPSTVLKLFPGLKLAIENRKTEFLAVNGLNTLPKPSVADSSYPILDRFHLFPKLPAEVRVMIWKLVSPESRIIKISLKSTTITVKLQLRRPSRASQFLEQIKNANPCRFRSDENLPVTLQINKESRVEALKRFKLSYPFGMNKGPAIYIDFSTDTICFALLEKATKNEQGNVFLDRLKYWKLQGPNSLWSDFGMIQMLSCSHYELLALFEAPSLNIWTLSIAVFQSLREIFVDIDSASAGSRRVVSPLMYVSRAAMANAPFRPFYNYTNWSENRKNKMTLMQRPGWVEETELEDPGKKALFDEAMASMNKFAENNPKWKVPNLHFGYMERKELREEVAVFDRELNTLAV